MAHDLSDGFLFNKVKDTVKSLALLVGSIENEDDVARYAAFTAVEHVAFHEAVGCLNLTALVESMCRVEDPLWPRLRSLEINMRDWDDQLTGSWEHGALLARLVHNRTERGAAAGARVCPLEKLKVRQAYIERWATAQLRELLGNNFEALGL